MLLMAPRARLGVGLQPRFERGERCLFLAVSNGGKKLLSMKSLNYHQVGKMVATPQERSPFGVRDRCLMEIFYLTGLRVYEMSMLDVGHVARRTDEIRELLDMQAVICKYSRGRVIPITDRK